MTIDSRGPRFGAAITTVVVAVVLVLSGVSHLAAGWLLAAQTVVFAVGALAGIVAHKKRILSQLAVLSRPSSTLPVPTTPEANTCANTYFPER